MLADLLAATAVPLLIGVMTLLVCWRVGAWADRLANREPSAECGSVAVFADDSTEADPVDEHFSQTPVFGVPIHKTAEAMQRWRDLVAPGLPDDAEAIVLDPEPSLREQAIEAVLGLRPEPSAEVAPGAVRLGRNALCRACLNARLDREYDLICDLCRPALLGMHAAAPSEPTSGGSSL
jgi:hypothetical protein